LDLEAITASLRVQSGNFVAFSSFRENTSDFAIGSCRKTEKAVMTWLFRLIPRTRRAIGAMLFWRKINLAARQAGVRDHPARRRKTTNVGMLARPGSSRAHKFRRV